MINLLALAFAVAAPGAAVAQDAAAAGPKVTDLDDATLLARAGAADARLADAEKALGSEQKTLAAGADLLEAKRSELAALRVPDDKPPAHQMAATPATTAKAARDLAAARHDALRARLKLVEDEKSLLEDRAKHFEKALAARKTVAGALDDAEPLAVELEVRIARIAAEKTPAALTTRAIRERRASLSATKARWEREAKTVQSELAAIVARVTAARDDAKAAEAGLAAASRAADELKRREAIEGELSDRDPAALVALLSTLGVDRERLAQALEPVRIAFEKSRAGVAAAEAELARESPPDPDNVPVDSGPARVMAAQRTFNLVRFVADYQKRRSEKLGALKAALVASSEKATTVATSASDLDATLLRMSVIASMLETRRGADKHSQAESVPEAPTSASIEEARRRVAVVAEAAASALEDARTGAPKLDKQIAEAVAVEKAQRDKLGSLENAYDQAKTNARWTKEVERLGTADVVQLFREAREKLRVVELSVETARGGLAAAEAAVASASIGLASFDDPLSRRAREENAHERQRIVAALAKLLNQPPPIDPPTAAKPPDPLATSSAESGDGSSSKGSAALAAALEAREAALASRAQSLGKYVTELDAFIDLLGRASKAAAQLVAALRDESTVIQRVYGAALELQTRAGLGDVGRDQLPPGVSDVATHDRVLAVESDLAAAQSVQSGLEGRRTRFLARRDDDVRTRDLLEKAVAIHAKLVDALRDRAQREASYERPEASLTDTETKRRGQEVLRRLESEDSLLETVLDLFTNDRATALTDLLRSYYGDLLEFDRKRANIEERSKLTTDLLGISEEEQANAEARLPLARSRLARRRADEAAARIRAGLVAPTDQAALGYLQADGQAVPAPEPVPGADMVAVAEKLFVMRARVIAADSQVLELEQRLSTRGISVDKGARQDELGALATRLDRLGRDTQRTAAEVSQTRALRLKILERAALGSLVRLLLIPLVAFAIVRVMRAVGARIVKRARGDGASSTPEREHRAQTIVHVFTRASAGVVVTVAGVYMLRELRIDVTPIIASAGVVGLAVAFGAQALIRDFFAGFFILVENQYKIGDTVSIGDSKRESTGIVEKISLRMTVLRALDGTVFYVPNGNIQLVANLTRDWAKVVLKIAVGFEADLDHVTAVLNRVGKELESDPVIGGKILEPPVVLGIEEFGTSAITLSVVFRTLPTEQLPVVREARLRIKKAFDKERIEIPLPQQVVHHIQPPRAASGPDASSPAK